MTGISYTSSFLLILSLSLISVTSTQDPGSTNLEVELMSYSASFFESSGDGSEDTTVSPDSTTIALTSTTLTTTTQSTTTLTTSTQSTTTLTTSTQSTTTLTTSTQSTAKTTTAKPIECANGGTPQPNNLACDCPEGFTGRNCNNVETNLVPDVIERAVDVVIEITERFSEKHEDTSSKEYEDVVGKFNRTVVPIYEKQIAKFLRVINIALRPGEPLRQRSQRRKRETESDLAVRVEHDVLLRIENNNESNKTYETQFETVNDVLKDIQSSTDLEFEVSSTGASKTEFNANDVCVKTTEAFPPEYRQYFEPAVLEGEVICVTPCNMAHSNRVVCENSGTCEVSEKGPNCYCLYTDDVWYLGERCTFQVHKVGFYAGLGSVAVLAVVTVALLTAYLIINKRTVKKSKDIKQELVKEWLEDDFEWPQQKTISNTADRYDNPVFPQGSMHNQDNFSANQSYTQNFSPEPDFYLRNFQRDQSMRMDRPQIRSSFDI